jgi:hypothetical protein
MQFERAKTGRSRCQATGQSIEKDEWRVGIMVWSMDQGDYTPRWQKPKAFLKSILFEYAPCEPAGRRVFGGAESL